MTRNLIRCSMLLTFVFGSSACQVVSKAEDLIAKLDAKVDGYAAKADAGIAAGTAVVHGVQIKVAEIDAKLNATASDLAAKGLDVDHGGTAFAKSLADHPGEIGTGSLGLLAALYAGWKRKQAIDAKATADASEAAHDDTKAELAATQTALGAVTQAVEVADNAGPIKQMTMEYIAKTTDAHAAIAEAKKTV